MSNTNSSAKRGGSYAWLPAAMFAGLVLAGCALPLAPKISTEHDVISHFGRPVDTHTLENGDRQFDYPRGPLGRETWRVTVSSDGTLQSIEQLLDEPYFARLTKGMSKFEVNRELGRHFIDSAYENLGEEVWSWRYMEFGNRQMFFNAHFETKTGLLTYTSRTPEFVHEVWRPRGF